MMSIMPEGEAIRRAVKWISSQLEEGSERTSPQKLVHEAVLRFDLSPKETEFLLAFYREEKSKIDPES